VTGYYNFLVSLILEEGVEQFLIFECVCLIGICTNWQCHRN